MRLIVRTALVWVLALGAACQGKADGQPPAAPPREVDVLTMAPTVARDTGDYLGSLLSRDSVTVLPQITGYVRKIHVRPGQKVPVGASLVEVDSREEGAELASARAQEESARAGLGLAVQSSERAEALFREGLASGEEIDQRRAGVAAASAAARAAAAQVTQRRVALQYNTIRAAVPGVIGDVLVRVGDYVGATTRLTTIAGPGALELTIAVPGVRARGLAVGAPVEILGDDGAVLLTTTAFFVAPDADPRTQLVEVKAALPAGTDLRSSELVRARLVYSSREALQVPVAAVMRQSGQAFVFAVVDKGGQLVVERRPVQLGALGASAYLLEGGLAAGDRIAVSSIQLLRDGAPVVIKDAAKGVDAAKEPGGAAAPASGIAPGAPAAPGTSSAPAQSRPAGR